MSKPPIHPEIDLSLCMLKDRAALAHALKVEKGSPTKKTLQRYHSSSTKLNHRIKNHPKPSFDSKLPINQRIEEIKTTVQQNQVTIICGETGSGKSTQIPKICLELGYGTAGLIGQTQPRRIAASLDSAGGRKGPRTCPGYDPADLPALGGVGRPGDTRLFRAGAKGPQTTS